MLFSGDITARSSKTGGNFGVYDLSKHKFILTVHSDKPQVNISFSPDESKIGFVRDNDLYVVELSSGKETRLTFDGSETILNGVFDWAYEEEFSIIQAWTWSPDSRSIAFWKTNQSAVQKFPVADFDSVYNTITYQYYPKTGYPVSTVSINIVDAASGKITKIDTGTDTNIYVPRIMFTADPEILSVQRLNRQQNKLELLFADIKTGKSDLILTEQDGQWVDVYDHLTFLSSKKQFIWPSERDGFLHLYLYDYNGKLIRQLTSGKYEVDAVKGINEKENLLYYTSNESSTLRKDLYSIKLDGTGKTKITPETGTHEVSCSFDCHYYFDIYSTLNKCPAYTLHNMKGDSLGSVMEMISSAVGKYDFIPAETGTFITTDSVMLNYYMVKPENYSDNVKYPLVIFNYSGPGSQSVTDSWLSRDYYFAQFFAQAGYIVFCVDNRGTGGRGKDFEHIVYKNLGKWEINDIIEGINYLNKRGMIDPARVGITGASYGGYISALSILKKPAYFKVAAAVAPVTDWQYYDAIYTERYMGDPVSNLSGYKFSSALNYAWMLKGKLLLVHGTADDNVHLQNTLNLSKQLIQAERKFDLMLYPGAKHGGFGAHYYQLVYDYFINNL
jgi:dipeptidyl-peptidase-4